MELSIIFPIYNEEKGLRKSVTEIILLLEPLFSHIEVLAVNDASKDNSLKILEELQRQDKRIKLISHNQNEGYGAALRTGLKNSKYDWIFFTDSDMQFNPAELKTFLPYTKDFDFIIGCRKNRADSLKRKTISFVYNRIIRIIFQLPLKDVDCAFKLMRKSDLQKIDFFSNSFFVSAEIMVKAKKMGIRIKEMGVNHYPRTSGKSTVTYGRVIKSMFDLLKLFRSIYL